MREDDASKGKQPSSNVWPDLAIGLAAGLFATSIIAKIQSGLYALMPEDAKKREEKVSPGSPTKVAAEKLAGQAHIRLNKQEKSAASTAIHFASGVPWGVLYTFMRRRSGMNPVGAALACGASMSLILDETLTPALGLSAPDRDYPTATHARAFAAHLAFGASVAIAAEALYRITHTAPGEARELPAGAPAH